MGTSVGREVARNSRGASCIVTRVLIRRLWGLHVFNYLPAGLRSCASICSTPRPCFLSFRNCSYVDPRSKGARIPKSTARDLPSFPRNYNVKSSQVVGLRDRVAIIRALLLHAISSPQPYAGNGDLSGVVGLRECQVIGKSSQVKSCGATHSRTRSTLIFSSPHPLTRALARSEWGRVCGTGKGNQQMPTILNKYIRQYRRHY